MKTFIENKQKVLVSILILFLILFGVGGYFLLYNQRDDVAERTPGDTPVLEDLPSVDEAAFQEVMMNNEQMIHAGDEISILRPDFWENVTTIQGKVIDLYPEEGKALLGTQDGVVEVSYRYILDVDIASEKREGTEDEAFGNIIRAAIVTGTDGKEYVQYLYDANNYDSALNYPAMDMDFTDTYEPLKRYSFAQRPEGELEGDSSIQAPDYIVDFYRNYKEQLSAT